MFLNGEYLYLITFKCPNRSYIGHVAVNTGRNYINMYTVTL